MRHQRHGPLEPTVAIEHHIQQHQSTMALRFSFSSVVQILIQTFFFVVFWFFFFYFQGGLGDSSDVTQGKLMNQLDIYTPSSDSWQQLASGFVRFCWFFFCEFWVVSFRWRYFYLTQCVQYLQFINVSFVRPSARSEHSAIFYKSQLFIFGGLTNTLSETRSNELWVYILVFFLCSHSSRCLKKQYTIFNIINNRFLI